MKNFVVYAGALLYVVGLPWSFFFNLRKLVHHAALGVLRAGDWPLGFHYFKTSHNSSLPELVCKARLQ